MSRYDISVPSELLLSGDNNRVDLTSLQHEEGIDLRSRELEGVSAPVGVVDDSGDHKSAIVEAATTSSLLKKANSARKKTQKKRVAKMAETEVDGKIKLRKATTAYMLFSTEVRPKLVEDNPTMSFVEVGRRMGQMWNELAAEHKKPYEDEAARQKLAHDSRRAELKTAGRLHEEAPRRKLPAGLGSVLGKGQRKAASGKHGGKALASAPAVNVAVGVAGVAGGNMVPNAMGVMPGLMLQQYVQQQRMLEAMAHQQMQAQHHQQRQLQIQEAAAAAAAVAAAVPEPPKRWLTAFVYFSKAARPQTKAENPKASFGELGSALGAKWRSMTPEEKLPYVKQSEKDQQRFAEEMAQWKLVCKTVAAEKKKTEKKLKGGVKKSNGYTLFMREQRGAVKLANPNADFRQMSKLMGEMWKQLDDATREQFRVRSVQLQKESEAAHAAQTAAASVLPLNYGGIPHHLTTFNSLVPLTSFAPLGKSGKASSKPKSRSTKPKVAADVATSSTATATGTTGTATATAASTTTTATAKKKNNKRKAAAPAPQVEGEAPAIDAAAPVKAKKAATKARTKKPRTEPTAVATAAH